MIVDENATASTYLNTLMNLFYTPTMYFDGGNEVYVGASQTSMINAIVTCGEYEVYDIDLSVSVAWLGNAQVEVTVVIKNNHFVNTAPETPTTPGGPAIGVSGSEIPLTMETTDFDIHNLWYMFDFGNDEFSEWIGPFESGEAATYNHIWYTYGEDFSYRVKAKDEYDDETDWSPYNYIDIVQRGDANGDGSVNIGDAVFLISYIFKGGAAPDPIDRADANCDYSVNIGDAVFVINYIFGGGPAPSCE